MATTDKSDESSAAAGIAPQKECDFCIGCGLCEAMTNRRICMVMTDHGSLHPSPVDAFTPKEEATLLSACHGVTVEPRYREAVHADRIWGPIPACVTPGPAIRICDSEPRPAARSALVACIS